MLYKTEDGKLYYVDNRRFIINTGNNVNQSINSNNVNQEILIEQSFPEELFSRLLDEIQKINDEKIRKEAEFFAEELRKSIQNQDKSTASKLLKFLRDRVHDISVLTSIASFLGITFPS